MSFKENLLEAKGFLKNRKGMALGDLSPAVLVLVVAIIVVAVGANIVQQVRDQMTAGSAAYNASNTGLSAITTFSTWFSVIAIVVAAVIVIGLIVRAFGGAGRD